MTFEEVVKALDAETLSYSIEIGSPLQEGISLRIKVSKEKYEVAIAWLSDLLFGSHFSIERFVSHFSLASPPLVDCLHFFDIFHRLKISATKALQDIPGEKRDGAEVSYSAYKKLIASADRSVFFPDYRPPIFY